MSKRITEETIYEFDDKEIIRDINTKLKRLRENCLYTQERLAKESGVSLGTIKRIESSSCGDLSIGTILKILRPLGELQNIIGIIPQVPESPFKIKEIWGTR